MPIVLPEDHPLATLGVSPDDAERRTRLRIGIINIMPRIEAYEPNLLGPLARSPQLVEPVFVRLGSHAYQSSDHGHLDRFYQSFDAVLAEGSLDGLVLTGAPVEEIPFEEVHYWQELRGILEYARTSLGSTVGLCWGGMALGRVLGVEKRLYPKKLFGVFAERALLPSHDLLPPAPSSFVCAHSRHSGMVQAEMERAAQDGVLRILSRGEKTGSSVFETPDGRFVGHLGHPEYEGERLAFEWKRDRDLGRSDVDPPADFDADAPTTPWRDHRETFISGFVARVARRAEGSHADS